MTARLHRRTEGRRRLSGQALAERDAALIAAASGGACPAELGAQFRLSPQYVSNLLARARADGSLTIHFAPGPKKGSRPSRAGQHSKPKPDAPAPKPVVETDAGAASLPALIDRGLGVTAIGALTRLPYREIMEAMDRRGRSHVPS